ncbi:hypothetical protein ZIOFF_009013 [Zingiber officinale]|uniref:Uncharacterized protein n=1 Tax=Zingiber officinale TaxID=94328 RepID=A0A8J5I275_ZINOF|nr:hypothetical protein ZIOFF_009013 [Zingiber officinale]
MEACASNFGMARLINALDTHLSISTLADTPGYLLTGRRPTDKEDFGDTNLVGWVKMKVREGKGREVFDGKLLLMGGGEATEEEMERFLEITLKCVDDFPSKRPNMMQVVTMLKELSPAGDVAAAIP